MSIIAGEIVLIHVHGGTLISAFSFTTTEAKKAFEANHKSDDRHDRYLPGKERTYRTMDDPFDDTWIEVEGALIEYVDGSTPEQHACTTECES